MTIDADTGDLVLTTGTSEVRQHTPVAYQEVNGVRVPVAARYTAREDGNIGFVVGGYDAALPLVIDPSLTYSTYLGGTGNDTGKGIAVDTSGNAYVTGTTTSTDFPTQTPFQGANGGGGKVDVFVTKLNATGTALIYSTYLGGTSNDGGNGIAVDDSGNAYVTGYTESANFPVTPGAFQHSYGGNRDGFVTKLNPAGATLVYSSYLGGADGPDYGSGIAVDSTGNAYVTGTTQSANFPLTMGAYLTTISLGFYDTFPIIAFVTKLNTSGMLIYSTLLGPTFPPDVGGAGRVYGNGIAIDSGGNAYVTGQTESRTFPVTPGAYQTTTGGNQDAFVTKLNAAGSALVYSTYLGGAAEDGGWHRGG